MDFIGGCEGRWRRNKVVQPEDGGVGFDTKTQTHHQVDRSNGNDKNARGGGGVVRCEYHSPPPFILPRLQMQGEDRRAYACRISDALAHLHVCSTRRADYLAYSSHARSLTPAWCFFQTREGSKRAANGVRSSPGFDQTSQSSFWRRLPRRMLAI